MLQSTYKCTWQIQTRITEPINQLTIIHCSIINTIMLYVYHHVHGYQIIAPINLTGDRVSFTNDTPFSDPFSWGTFYWKIKRIPDKNAHALSLVHTHHTKMCNVFIHIMQTMLGLLVHVHHTNMFTHKF